MTASIALTYNSLDIRSGPLGAKWSHNYDIEIIKGYGGSVIIREQDTRHYYSFANNAFTSQPGDYSRLSRTSDNGYVLAYENGRKKFFDANGRITSITDSNGDSLAFSYDEISRLATVTDSGGRITSFVYNTDNRITRITDPAGKNYSFSYTGNFLSTITWPDGSSWNYSYDGNGFMQSKTDPMGKVTTYAYDRTMKVAEGTTSAGKKSVVYPALSTGLSTVSLTQQDGGLWKYTYDARNGYLTQKTDPTGQSTTYAYDANHNLIKETAPDGTVTSYTYDASGNMLTTTTAAGTTTYTYNSLGAITSIRDPLGHTTTNTYDGQGRLTETADPMGAKTINRYDSRGNLIEVTNALNQKTTYTYDAAGNQTSATDATGATTSFTYDAMGNLLSQRDPLGNVTTFEYDDRYRLVKTTDALGNATSYTYDLSGNKTSQTDANGNTTAYEYDDKGHVTKTIDALGNATSFTYGTSGCTSCGGGSDRMTSLTDAKGQTTRYQYDLLGRLVQETDPLGKITTYGYDAVGNLITRTDANGATITYGYDAVRRLTSKRYPDGSSETYSYDAAGRMTSATNASVGYTYAYDAAGRVTLATDSRGYTITYAYDALGNRTKMTLQPRAPDERVTSFSYDAAGRISTITSPAGTFTYGYDAAGRRTSLLYPNQVTASYTYDKAGRLTSLVHAAGATTIAKFVYTLDKVGNRVGRDGTNPEQYLYDKTYQLLQVVSPTPETFSYDEVGNRKSGPGVKDTGYVHNAGNQMLQGRRLQYGYDNNENQISRTIPGVSDKTWTQTWDNENRLVKVEKTKGAEKLTVTFSYDPVGRRVRKQVTQVKDGVTRTTSWSYVYDNDNIVMWTESNSGNSVKTFFSHGPNVDEHLSQERPDRFSYYHADGLGSVVAVTDTNRLVVEEFSYTSFGLSKTAPTSTNSFTYTGTEWDKETGLHYFLHRYYDPMDGRFISKDPISIAGGNANLYGYVNNNSTNYVDPDGLQAVAVPGGALPIFIPPGSVFQPGSRPNNGFVYSVREMLKLFDPRPLVDSLCKDGKEDRFKQCKEQWIADTAWCDTHFTGRKNVACHRWAEEEFERCKKRKPSQPFTL